MRQGWQLKPWHFVGICYQVFTIHHEACICTFNTFTDLVALTQAEKSTNGFPIMHVPFINSFFTSYFPTAKNTWILKCFWQRRRWVSVKCSEKTPLREWIELSGWKGHSIMENINSNVTRHANTITFSNVTLDRPW